MAHTYFWPCENAQPLPAADGKDFDPSSRASSYYTFISANIMYGNGFIKHADICFVRGKQSRCVMPLSFVPFSKTIKDAVSLSHSGAL